MFSQMCVIPSVDEVGGGVLPSMYHRLHDYMTGWSASRGVCLWGGVGVVVEGGQPEAKQVMPSVRTV